MRFLFDCLIVSYLVMGGINPKEATEYPFNSRSSFYFSLLLKLSSPTISLPFYSPLRRATGNPPPLQYKLWHGILVRSSADLLLS